MQPSSSEFVSVPAYCEADFSARSEVGAVLIAEAAAEAGHASIQLSNLDRGDAWASNLTPSMTAWLDGEVAPFRGQAIGELVGQASAIKVGRSEGIWLEHETDTVNRRFSRRRAELEGQFALANAELVAEQGACEDRYDGLKRDEGGRDAKVTNPFIEWGVLFPLILLPESLLNFDSFRRAPIIASDAMALGITIIVGVGIAIAAHFFGTLAKQLDYWMRPDDKVQQGKGLRMAILGSLLLTASLSSIGVARYYYLLPLRAEAVILGQVPPNFGMQIGASLIGNIVVFLIGAAFAFLLHDTNPEFAETKRKLDRSNARYATARARTLTTKVAEAKAAADRDHARLEGIDRQMQGKPGFPALKTQAAKFAAQDAKVVATLATYRARLASDLRARDPDFRFYRLPLDDRFSGDEVPLDKFLAETIRLYRGSLK